MTLHEDARRALAGWPAPDPRQERLRADYVAHLDEHGAEAVRRANASGHLTASALVVSPGRDRVLLTLHRKLKMWLQTGGHCEPEDAALAEAALREAAEESGIAGLRLAAGGAPIALDRHQVPCHGRGVPLVDHLDVQYAAVAPAGAEPVVGDESDDVRWFPADALPEGTDDSVRRLVAAALRV